jgi:alkylation response protein AidB-like acyl-CoA dehydrogenase
MHFAFTEEQEVLRATARAFLAEHSSSERVRVAMESELGFDTELWKRIGAELGWPAVAIPEAFGGLGLGMVELTALLETMGEALLCAPFFSTVCLAAPALLASGDGAACRAWLPGIAEGRTLAALAFGGTSGQPEADAVQATWRREGVAFVLDGPARFVLDGHCAELLLVAARRPESRGAEGIGLFAVPAAAPGVARRALPTMDRTRRLADVTLSGVRVGGEAALGDPERGWAAVAKALDRGAVALAAEQVGGAQRCLDMAVAYAKERVQFGRPIGAFQAIKHTCAETMVRVESARSAAYYAACVAAEDAPELPVATSLAKASASEAFFHAAAESLQVHGGVGFTWEYDVHLYLKRARAGEAFLGAPAWHRERIARHILEEPA